MILNPCLIEYKARVLATRAPKTYLNNPTYAITPQDLEGFLKDLLGATEREVLEKVCATLETVLTNDQISCNQTVTEIQRIINQWKQK